MQNKVTIYTLADPRNGEIRYVGKATDLVNRFRAHCNDRDGTHKSNWVQSLRKIGLRPQIEVLEVVDESEWSETERFWIENMRQLGFRLTNSDAGGMGGFPRSAEVKAKISAKHKGKVLSLEHRKKLSESKKNMSPEQKAILTQRIKKFRPSADDQKRSGLARLGQKRSLEAIAKTAAKNRGKKRTPEQCAQFSEAHKGLKRSKESLVKSSASLKRFYQLHPMPPHSEEQKTKLRAAWVIRKQRELQPISQELINN